MITVNGKIIEQNYFSAGELNIKLYPCLSEADKIFIEWKYESDRELFTLACIRNYYSNKYCELYIP